MNDYKEISLSNTETKCLVSDQDYKLICKYKWRNCRGYACTDMKNKTVRMHRYIMNAPNDMIVDHINRNRLDNRRENLRLMPKKSNINAINKSLSKSKKSCQYFGVTFTKQRNKFIARNNRKHIGSFETALEAAEAYDMYVVHNNLEYNPLNFPEKKEYYLAQEYKQKQPIIKKSKFIGVTVDGNKFVTKVSINGKQTNIFHSFDDEECAHAYDIFVVENNIPGRKLNFPELYPSYTSDSNVIKNKYIEDPNDNTTIKLLLYNNTECLIDKEDYERLKYYKCSHYNNYVYINDKRKNIRLSRFLLNVTDDNMMVDHIDSNPLNNKKSNLRIVTPQMNAQNTSKKSTKTTSKYLGVSYHNRDQNRTRRILLAEIIFRDG